jgi:hypothetical protein
MRLSATQAVDEGIILPNSLIGEVFGSTGLVQSHGHDSNFPILEGREVIWIEEEKVTRGKSFLSLSSWE